jgi:putative heme-binding domain-containing protein
MIHDFGGGSPCGGWVYLDDGVSPTYRGRIFHCEWGQGKVLAVQVAPDGAGFKFVDQLAFLEPGDVKDFRPFSLRPTADGRGFYVTDWGYSGWLNPTKAGRMWKVTYTGEEAWPAPRGKDTDSIEQLIKALDHPAHSERLRAQRELIARGREVAELLKQRSQEGKLSPLSRRHALWVLRETNPSSAVELALELRKDQDPEVRLEAVRVLGSVSSSMDPERRIVGRLRDMLFKKDPDPFVRAAVAAAITGKLARGPGLPQLAAYETEVDSFVRYALIQSVKRSSDWEPFAKRIQADSFLLWVQSAVNGTCWALSNEYQLASVLILRQFLRHSTPSVRFRSVETLSRLYFERKRYDGGWWGTQPAGQKPPLRIVAWEGTPKVRAAILAALADKDAGVRKAAVNALIAASDPETLEPLFKRFQAENDAAARADLVRAVAGLDTAKAIDFLITILHDEKNAVDLRSEAVAGLERFNRSGVIDALVLLLRPNEPAALQMRALEALGNLKATNAQQPVMGALKSKEPTVRRAAAIALGKLGQSRAVRSLLAVLEDRDNTVKIAALQALSWLSGKLTANEKAEVITALLPLVQQEAMQFDAINVLTHLPDKRALSAYLTGLASKNAEQRAACRHAIAAVRENVVATLEQLAKRNEIPTAALAELREVYSSHVPILSWRIIGPFPRDGKAYPPEQEQKFDAVYKGAEKDIKWQTVQADAKQHGRVNLEARFQPNQQVIAYAYAEIDSATARYATLLIGSDDTITIWLNGKQVHDFPSDRAWAYNQDKVNVHLERGKNRLLLRCGNSGGPWDYSVAVSAAVDRYAFLKGGVQKFDLEAFRSYARKNKGDPERGRKLFLDVKGLACVKCHALGGQGGQVGPDLAGIGLRYNREDLMTSILEPSKVIAQGYETIVIETKKGVTLTGVFRGESGDAVNLTDAEGKSHRVLNNDIEERTFSAVSTMPNGLSDGMSLQDFADLVAFLEARRKEKK